MKVTVIPIVIGALGITLRGLVQGKYILVNKEIKTKRHSP